MRGVDISSMHEPPQKNTHLRVRMILLYWIENIPSKGEFGSFFCTFALSDEDWLFFTATRS